jgi:U6 snRNA-associated Sm-like protein LSm2
MAVKNCFIRGSVVRYVQLPAEHVDTQLLEDATRRGEVIFIMNSGGLTMYFPDAMNQAKR